MTESKLFLKDMVSFDALLHYGSFAIRPVVYGNIDNGDFWYSYWRNVDAHGTLAFIEIHNKTREIKCDGCLDVLFDMIQDGLVEKREMEVEMTVAEYYKNHGY